MKVYNYIDRITGKPADIFGVCTSCGEKDIPCPEQYELKLIAHENANFPCRYCLAEKLEVTASGKSYGFAK